MALTRSRGIARLALVTLLAAPALPAQTIITPDPRGDFLPTYTVGPKSPDLDVLGVSFTFDGTTFHFRSDQAGPIDPASGHLFVWGINRGAGTQGFPVIAPGVLFDAVMAINPGAATNSVRGNVLPAGAVTFSGNSLFIDVPASFLPSTGFRFDQYTANLWPRSQAGQDNVIADFAPDNSNILVQTTPEPATFALVAPVLVAGALVRRKQRRA